MVSAQIASGDLRLDAILLQEAIRKSARAGATAKRDSMN